MAASSKATLVRQVEENRARFITWFEAARSTGVGRNVMSASLPFTWHEFNPAHLSTAGITDLILPDDEDKIINAKALFRQAAISGFRNGYYTQAELSAFLAEGDMEEYVPMVRVTAQVTLRYSVPMSEVSPSGSLLQTERTDVTDSLSTALVEAIAGIGTGDSVNNRVVNSSASVEQLI